MSNRIYGWFASADHSEPAHDPPHDAPCLLCGDSVFAGDVRTISLMWADRDDGRSYFYRVHATCGDRASAAEMEKIDGIVLDMVTRIDAS